MKCCVMLGKTQIGKARSLLLEVVPHPGWVPVGGARNVMTEADVIQCDYAVMC